MIDRATRSTAVLTIALAFACSSRDETKAALDEKKPPSSPEAEPARKNPVTCPPATLSFQSPAVYAPGNESAGSPCPSPDDLVDDGHTDRVLGPPQPGKAGELEFTVRAFGPEGSGRYWLVFVSTPKGGLCITTSTVGFRTLGGTTAVSDLIPLKWVQDIDGDGTDEVVLWGSRPRTDHSSLSDYGLSPVVYSVSVTTLDQSPPLSAKARKQTAEVYRKAASEGDAAVRKEIAALLEKPHAPCKAGE